MNRTGPAKISLFSNVQLMAAAGMRFILRAGDLSLRRLMIMKKI